MIAALPLLVLLFVAPPKPQPPAEAGPMPRVAPEARGIAEFTLTERSGRTVSLADLSGKVWIASFIVTRCPDGKCPQVTQTLQRLQRDLANVPNLVLVTFTADPKDDPAELERYADAHEADPERWLFLTGNESEIHDLLLSFHLRGPANKVGDTDHAQKLILVDHTGKVRGYYDGLDSPHAPEGDFERNLTSLKKSANRLAAEVRPSWMPWPFPSFNAVLNGLAACLIFTGWVAIKSRLTRLHILCMGSALIVSAIFLSSYLYFHLAVKVGQPTRFAQMAPDAPGWVGTLYGGILLTHTILAVFATPMAVVSAYLGVRDRLKGHVRLARWTMPIWLYVSVTGVVVYWMLYRLY